MEVDYSKYELENTRIPVTVGEALYMVSGQREAENDFDPTCECGKNFDVMNRTNQDVRTVDGVHLFMDRENGYDCPDCGARWEFFVGQNKHVLKEKLS